MGGGVDLTQQFRNQEENGVGVYVPWGKFDGAHVSEYPWSCARHPGDYHPLTNLRERERETRFENKINETMQ